MSKYANLPDIDISAPDIYETDDVPVSSDALNDDSSDDENISKLRGGKVVAGPEELDPSRLPGTSEATRRFRRAERLNEQIRARTRYTYPPSPTDDSDPTRQPAPAYRLKQLQAELSALELELSQASVDDHNESAIDAHDELLQGLVDVRGRLERLGKGKSKADARTKLVEAVVTNNVPSREVSTKDVNVASATAAPSSSKGTSVADMDRRVGQLEELVGSSSTSLDETTPLTPPLLPLLVRLNAQITLLTQPRHIDSVSRRLKLLLSDLDRVAAHPAGGRRGTQGGSGHAHTSSGQGAPLAPTHAETLAPMLARLSNTLPHVPHVLARLRTLAALHAAAGEFSQTLDSLEAEQRRGRTSLEELSSAVGEVEKSLEANRALVESNVKGLEERVGVVMERLQSLDS